MKLKLVFSWLLLQGLILNATAQITPIENVQSPDVAALGQYGAIPVSLYTGVPNISIPLYDVKVGNYSLPISVSYHLASVKPTVPSGTLGLGWSLVAGGYITRSVRGIYDEKKTTVTTNNVTTTTYPGYYANASKMKGMTTEQFKAFWGQEFWNYELIADEFSFNFCGYSGNFYYNEDCGWSVVSDQDIKVVFDEANDGFISLDQLERTRIKTRSWSNWSQNQRFFNKFTLITPDGTRYEFGGTNATEYSISYYLRNRSDLIATTWKLSKITTVDKREIEFVYDTSGIICDLKYVPQYYFVGNDNVPGSNPTIGRAAMTGFLVFPANIKEIRTTNELIEFNYSKDPYYYESFAPQIQCLGWNDDGKYNRFDIYKQMNEVVSTHFGAFLKVDPNLKNPTEFCKYIYNNNNLDNSILRTIQVKNYEVLDGYKKIRFDYIANKDERRKLVAIKESPETYSSPRGLGDIVPGDPDGPVFDAIDPKARFHRFTYNTTTKMPISCIKPKVDSWGYYTGFSYDDFLHPEFLPGGPYSFGATADILTEIRYPTGGKSKFEYELHDYSQVVSPSRISLNAKSSNAGGLRIKKITNTDFLDNIMQIKKYYYSEDRETMSSSSSSGILKNLPIHNVEYTLHNGVIVEFGSIGGFFGSVTNQNSPDVGYSCVIEELLDGNNVSMGYIRYRYSNYDQDIYGQTHFDEQPLYSSINPSQDHYIKPYTSRSMERGKLQSEEHYDKNNVLKKKITYQYAKDNTSYMRTAHQMLLTILSPYVHEIIGSLTKTYLYSYLLDKVTETLYTGASGIPVEQTKTFTYNGQKLLQTETVSTSRSVRTVEYKYLPEQSNYSGLGLDHVLSPIIEKKMTEGADIKKESFQYGSKAGIPYIAEATTVINQNYTRTEYSVNRTDSWGNPMEITVKGLETVFLWGYQGQKLIAKIVNATLRSLYLSNNLYDTGESQDSYFEIENIGTNFPSAQFYIYKYNDRLQLQSITNPNWITTYFTYDFLGRLIERYYIGNVNGASEERILNKYGYFYPGF